MPGTPFLPRERICWDRGIAAPKLHCTTRGSTQGRNFSLRKGFGRDVGAWKGRTQHLCTGQDCGIAPALSWGSSQCSQWKLRCFHRSLPVLGAGEGLGGSEGAELFPNFPSGARQEQQEAAGFPSVAGVRNSVQYP